MHPKLTFADVAGVDEAVAELHEIRDYLANPQIPGARRAVPKGVLLFGPPGTGKTLLASAVAGEAGVPSSPSPARTSSSRSSASAPPACATFREGAQNSPAHLHRRVRRRRPPRGAGIGSGNDEREQTLNQLLVEMDGFEMKATSS